MKATYPPGTRLVRQGQVLHIKAIRANDALTTRGIKTFDELQEWTIEPLQKKKFVTATALLVPDEKVAVYKHFKNPAAAIRYALQKVQEEQR